MNIFDTVLPQLSVEIQSSNGKLPLTIKGPVVPKNIIIDGSSGSQFLTGLLMAYSSFDLHESVVIKVNSLKSKPYIDLTLSVIESFGLNLPLNDGYDNFTFMPARKNNSTQDVEYEIESDWSGASFLLVAAAIAGKIKLKGISKGSKQADKAILDEIGRAHV